MSTPAAPAAKQRDPEHRDHDRPVDERKVIVVDGQSPTLEFQQWPLRDEPGSSAIVAGVVTAISIAIGLIAGDWVWGSGAAMALLAALWRMWIPVDFRLCELGIIQTAMRRSWRTPWQSLAGFEERQAGILLLPDDDDSILGRLKALYIPWGKRREELLDVVEHYFAEEP